MPDLRYPLLYLSILALAPGFAACGEHERVSERQGQVAMAPEDHEIVHAAVERIQTGRVAAGLAQLGQLKGAQLREGQSAEWLPSVVEALLGQGEFSRVDSLLSVVGSPTQRPADLRYWTAQLEMARGNPSSALPHFEAAFEEPVWGVPALFEAAMLESAEGERERCVELCRRLLQREAHHESARILLASTLLELGRVDAALESAREIASEGARTSLFAQGHLLADRPDEALATLREATGFQGTLRDYLEGWALLEGGDAAGAIRLLSKLTGPDGRPYKDSRRLLARAYRASGDEATAARLEKLEDDAQTRIAALRLQDQAVRVAQRGDLVEGHRLLLQALELAPDDGSILNDLAAVLTRMQRFEEAESTFLRAVELRPQDASIAGNMAQLYSIMGLPEKAKEQERRYHSLRGN